MNYDVTPEPTDDERRALEAALERAGPPAAYASAWRRAALEENEDDAPARRDLGG